MRSATAPDEGTTDAVDRLSRDLGIGGNASRERSVAEETEKLEIAEKVYAIRESLGLSVRQFARLVGLNDTAISRLERADYANMPSVRTLARIAKASGYRLRVDFVSVSPSGRIARVRPKVKRAKTAKRPSLAVVPADRKGQPTGRAQGRAGGRASSASVPPTAFAPPRRPKLKVAV